MIFDDLEIKASGFGKDTLAPVLRTRDWGRGGVRQITKLKHGVISNPNLELEPRNPKLPAVIGH